MSCEDCCRRCCYSTPYGTLCALSIILVGVVGFVASSVYGVVLLSSTDPINQHALIFGPILGGVIVLSVFPILLSTIMAYCVTGYIRDELFASVVKKFIGKCCSFSSMCLNFSIFFLWMLVTVALSAVLIVFVLLKLGCDEFDGELSRTDCLPSGNYSFLTQVCGDDLEGLCNDGQNVGIAFVASLGFALFILIGIVLTLILQGANYVNARENMEYRRSYQPRTNANDEYLMKRVH